MEEINLVKLFKIPAPKQLDINDTVLVVDSQQDLRLIVAHHLNKLQFKKVIQASNGLEALEAMRTNSNVAAIICDMDMPGMGGLDFLAELRENINLNRVPFCLSMNQVSKEKIMLSVENGVDEVLVKPFTLGDLIPKIKNAFKVFHNPKNPEKVYELAKKCLRDNALDEAEKIYKTLEKAASKAARPLVGLARVEKIRKNTDKALEYLKLAEEKNPNYVHIFSIRGDIFAGIQDWDSALKSYNLGIDLSPLNPIRYISAVEVLMKVKKYKEVTELLNKANKAEVNFPALYHYQSQAYYNLKDYKLAIRSIKHALNGEPENIGYLNQLGIALKESSQIKEATQAYNRIIKIEPNNIPALFNKSILLQESGQLDDAIKTLQRVLNKDPEQTQAIAKMKEFEDLVKKQHEKKDSE